MSKFCHNCGKSMPSLDVKFCPYCGTNLMSLSSKPLPPEQATHAQSFTPAIPNSDDEDFDSEQHVTKIRSISRSLKGFELDFKPDQPANETVVGVAMEGVHLKTKPSEIISTRPTISPEQALQDFQKEAGTFKKTS